MLVPIPDYEVLPFPPGTSPFHIKGIAYRAHVEYADKYIPGGSAAVIAGLRTPELRAFFEQRFLASTFHDVFPMIPVWYVCAQLTRQSPVEFLKTRARHQALEDIHGVYRVLLKLASAEAVALRMPRLVAQYFDFVSTTAEVVRPGVIVAEGTGIPALILPWFRIVAETYVLVALELAGAKRAKLLRYRTEPDGEAHGIPVAKMGIDIHLT